MQWQSGFKADFAWRGHKTTSLGFRMLRCVQLDRREPPSAFKLTLRSERALIAIVSCMTADSKVVFATFEIQLLGVYVYQART